nr:hypothetical protein [Eubacterium sp.]
MRNRRSTAYVIFCVATFFVLSLLVSRVTEAASKVLTEEEYATVVEETIGLAEFFRADEDFIYEANSGLTKAQTTSLKEELLPQIFASANATTEAEKAAAIIAYVRLHMTVYEGEESPDYVNTYEMLCQYPEENDGALFVGDVYNYTLAVRDLCALSDIPVFLVGDENAYTFHNYQIVMIYVNNQWKFCDVFASSTLMEGSELYAALHENFQPAKVNFGYTGGNSVIGYAGSIYVNATMYAMETGNNNFNLVYEKEKQAVIKRGAGGTVIADSLYYGSDQKTDTDGKVPTGILTRTTIDGVTNGTWRWTRAYSQHGVVLQGWVEIDGEEYNFSEFGSAQSLPYYELVREEAPTEEELAAVNADVNDRVKLTSEICDALLADETFQFFMDYTEAELAYLKEAAEVAITEEYVAMFEPSNAEVPEEEYTDYMKAQGLVNYLKYNVDYVGGVVMQDVYTTLTTKRGTCANYSAALMELCTFHDIPCFSLGGMLSNQRSPEGELPDHAYNILKLDGKWYVCDPTNAMAIWESGTTSYVKPMSFQYCNFIQKGVYISHEMMLRDLTDPIAALCYDFDDEGNLGIYYMNRTGPIANYASKAFSTDENGKLLQNNGFVTWEEKVETEKGYEIWMYEGYVRQGYPVYGTQIIDGKQYVFPKESENFTKDMVGYAKEKSKSYYQIDLMERGEMNTSFTYTGENICPEPVIKHGDTVLQKGVDYTVSYYNNRTVTTEATGKARMTVEGIGSYYDSYVVQYDIVPKEITEADVTFSQEEFVWNMDVDKAGGFSWPEVTVNAPENEYTVSCTGFSGMTEGKVLVKGRYNCTGTVEKTFPLKPMELTEGEFRVAVDSTNEFVYKKGAWEPAITVTWHADDGSVYRTLSSAEYDVKYENNTEVGTAKITVTGDGRFAGELSSTFEIVKRDLSFDSRLKNALAQVVNQRYTGEAIVPNIPGVNYVDDYTDDIGYVVNEDYTLTVTDNVEAGTATITIQGIGNYEGSVTGTFQILPIEIAQEELVVTNGTVPYTGEVQLPQVVIGDLVAGEDYEVTCYRREYDEAGENYEETLVTPLEAGLYYVKIELLNPNYVFWYSEMTKWRNFYIQESSVPIGPVITPTPAPIPTSAPTPTTPPSGETGEGTSGSGNSEVLSPSGSGDASTGSENPTNVADTTINQENAKETDISQEKIVVSKVKKLKLKKQKKNLVIQWKKATKANGYQLEISTNKKFKKAKRISLGAKKTKYKMKNGKKGKKYFVRIRAYQSVANVGGKGKKVYGKWVVKSLHL